MHELHVVDNALIQSGYIKNQRVDSVPEQYRFPEDLIHSVVELFLEPLCRISHTLNINRSFYFLRAVCLYCRLFIKLLSTSLAIAVKSFYGFR
jgi:hypothetical protein